MKLTVVLTRTKQAVLLFAVIVHLVSFSNVEWLGGAVVITSLSDQISDVPRAMDVQLGADLHQACITTTTEAGVCTELGASERAMQQELSRWHTGLTRFLLHRLQSHFLRDLYAVCVLLQYLVIFTVVAYMFALGYTRSPITVAPGTMWSCVGLSLSILTLLVLAACKPRHEVMIQTSVLSLEPTTNVWLLTTSILLTGAIVACDLYGLYHLGKYRAFAFIDAWALRVSEWCSKCMQRNETSDSIQRTDTTIKHERQASLV